MKRNIINYKHRWPKMRAALLTVLMLACFSLSAFAAEQRTATDKEETTSDMDIASMDQSELEKALAEGTVVFEPSDLDFGIMTIASGNAADIVNVAKAQVGISGRPNKFTRWLGTISGSYSYAWCHAFVSWCAAEAGCGSFVPKTASCAVGAQWFKDQGQWKSRTSGYTPQTGDIIYFDWGPNGGYDHVAIVDYVSSGRVHTVGGNEGNAVKIDGIQANGYALTDTQILGYGTPAYASRDQSLYSYGFDDPSNNKVITENSFLFQGWVDAKKGISSITCSINHGARYVETNLYTRPDVPNATAFRAEIDSKLLNLGNNDVALCVNFSDGTAVVAENRTVTWSPEYTYGFDDPSNNKVITENSFLFQGWVDAKKGISSITCSINRGACYVETNLYTRPDVPNATAFRAEIDSKLLNLGNNDVALCINFSDGTAAVAENRTVTWSPKLLWGFDSPTEGAEISDNQFPFSGWIESTKKIDHIICSLNDGEESFTANLYTRSDVPNAVAFRLDIDASHLHYGENSVAVRVYYADGTNETIATHKVKKCIDQCLENPQDKETFTCKDPWFLLQGWSADDNKAIDHFEFTLNGTRNETAANTRTDLGNNTRYYRVEIPINWLKNGKNEIEIFVCYADGISRSIGHVEVTGDVDHKWDDGKVTQKATCTEAGVKKFTCTNCHATRTEEVPAIGKHEHTELRNIKEATCAEEGYTGDTYCVDCDTKLSSGEVIAKKDHSWDDGEVIENATCTARGIRMYTCTACRATETEEIPSTGHRRTELRYAKEATCVEEGYTGDTYCTDCNTTISSGEAIAKKEHDFKSWEIIKDAQCTVDGRMQRICSVCGETEIETIEAKGHILGDWETAREATYDAEGERVRKCTICSEVVARESIPKQERPADEPESEQPSTEQPPTEQPSTEQPPTEQPPTEQPSTEQPSTEQPSTEQPPTEQPSTEQLSTEQPPTEQPSTEQQSTEQLSTEQQSTEQPSTEQPSIEQPSTEQQSTEQLSTEQLSTEQPSTERPSTEQPSTEQSPVQEPETETNLDEGQKKLPTAGKTLKDKASGGTFEVAGDRVSLIYKKPTDKNKTVIRIPDTVKVNGVKYKVTSIAANAFKNNQKICKVTIGKNILTVGKNAFTNCKKLVSISGGSNVTTIGDNAFNGCTKLKTVTLGERLTKIGKKAFYKCSTLTKIILPKKLKNLGKQAFFGCRNLRNITIKTKLLTKKNTGTNVFGSIPRNVKVKYPQGKQKSYKKLLGLK